MARGLAGLARGSTTTGLYQARGLAGEAAAAAAEVVGAAGAEAVGAAAAGAAASGARNAAKGAWRTPVLVGAAGAAALVAVNTVAVVPAGEVGVMDLFGKVQEEVSHPGLLIKNPLARLSTFSTKTQKAEFACQVPSKEGLNVELKLSVQYRVDPNCAVQLYKTVGPDLERVSQVLIEPQVRAAVRSTTAGHEAKALYTEDREKIRTDLMGKLNDQLAPRGIVVEDVPLQHIILPEKLKESIERKLQMEQETQRMDFVLRKEKQEAERKAIEAHGIAEFQRIVSNGIDEKLLRWKGVEATVELAKSENAKVVVIGQGKDGLPLILGGGVK